MYDIKQQAIITAVLVLFSSAVYAETVEVCGMIKYQENSINEVKLCDDITCSGNCTTASGFYERTSTIAVQKNAPLYACAIEESGYVTATEWKTNATQSGVVYVWMGGCSDPILGYCIDVQPPVVSAEPCKPL